MYEQVLLTNLFNSILGRSDICLGEKITHTHTDECMETKANRN